MADDNIGKIIEDETARRLEIMERPDYEYPAKAGLWDWIAICSVVVISTILIVCCMTGVIQ